jgi:hypothetical protein
MDDYLKPLFTTDVQKCRRHGVLLRSPSNALLGNVQIPKHLQVGFFGCRGLAATYL